MLEVGRSKDKMYSNVSAVPTIYLQTQSDLNYARGLHGAGLRYLRVVQPRRRTGYFMLYLELPRWVVRVRAWH